MPCIPRLQNVCLKDKPLASSRSSHSLPDCLFLTNLQNLLKNKKLLKSTQIDSNQPNPLKSSQSHSPKTAIEMGGLAVWRRGWRHG